MKEKLLKIQQEIGAIKKDSINPHFKNKYFDINTLLEAVKPVLNKHRVVLLQGLTHGVSGELALETLLVDVDNKGSEEIRYLCPIPQCADAQKYGSAISYFRRYALVSLLALEAEDDDGNTTVKPAKVSGTNINYPTKPDSDDIGF